MRKIVSKKNKKRYKYMCFLLVLALCSCQSEKEKESAADTVPGDDSDLEEVFKLAEISQSVREIAENKNQNLKAVESNKILTSKVSIEILSEQLMDAVSDAAYILSSAEDLTPFSFVIDTGGKAGERLVTAQLCEASEDMVMDGVQCWYDNGVIKISVWDPSDMSEPTQTTVKYVERFHYESGFEGNYEIIDANFDGYKDFAWLCHSGNQPVFYYLWLWDEEEQKFVEEPVYNEISSPVVDADRQVICGWSRNSVAGDGYTTFYKWVDGELISVRKISVWREFGATKYTMTVEDYKEGEITEVYRKELRTYEFDAERKKWLDLDYYGE